MSSTSLKFFLTDDEYNLYKIFYENVMKAHFNSEEIKKNENTN